MQYNDVVGRLQISEEFLEKRRKIIADRTREILSIEKYADNRAIHLAESIVLLGAKSEVLQSVKASLEASPVLKKYDAPIIIAMSYLYHMITAPEKVFGDYAEGLKEILKKVHRVMDNINWCFPEEDAMKHLGIEKLVA
jgi:hypothetical protein